MVGPPAAGPGLRKAVLQKAGAAGGGADTRLVPLRRAGYRIEHAAGGTAGWRAEGCLESSGG
jgi:hypothetical protein